MTYRAQSVECVIDQATSVTHASRLHARRKNPMTAMAMTSPSIMGTIKVAIIKYNVVYYILLMVVHIHLAADLLLLIRYRAVIHRGT